MVVTLQNENEDKHMKIITPGHKYELANMDNPQNGQVIQFIEKKRGEAESFVTVNDGTTNEEVLEMLVDRLTSLNSKLACRENSIAITHLETALLWLNKRTANRQKVGVEGTHKPHSRIQ